MTGLVLDIAGVAVEVVTDGDDARLRTVLGVLLVESPDRPTRTVDLRRGGLDTADVEAVLAAAVRAAIDESPHLLLHAGAVVRDGSAIVLPGASGEGKSTMTAACLRRGLGYVSDEMVALDLRSGDVTGLRRPLMLTPWSTRALGLGEHRGPGKAAVAPEALTATTVVHPVRVAHVVVARHGAVATTLAPMGAGAVLHEILAASFNHYVHGARAWEAATRLASTASGWHLEVADPESAAEAIATLPDPPDSPVRPGPPCPPDPSSGAAGPVA